MPDTLRDTKSLKVGDKVEIVADGRAYTMTATRVFDDPAASAADNPNVAVSLRPGGWGVTLHGSNVARYAARRTS